MDLPTSRPDRFVEADRLRARVNTVQAAALAGVCERTIYNWMRKGLIEFVRTPTGAVRIYVDTLLYADRRYA